jgi:hypothetical protein
VHLPRRRINKIVLAICAVAWALIALSFVVLRTPAPPLAVTVLDRQVAHLHFEVTQLGDIIAEINRKLGGAIDVNWIALADLGILPTDIVSMNMESATVGQTLNLLFHARKSHADGLVFETRNTRVCVTSKLGQAYVVRAYDVSDLADDYYAQHCDNSIHGLNVNANYVVRGSPTREECYAVLAQIICDAVCPEEWASAPFSEPSCRLMGTSFVFTIGPVKQKEIEAFIASLRRALASGNGHPAATTDRGNG